MAFEDVHVLTDRVAADTEGGPQFVQGQPGGLVPQEAAEYGVAGVRALGGRGVHRQPRAPADLGVASYLNMIHSKLMTLMTANTCITSHSLLMSGQRANPRVARASRKAQHETTLDVDHVCSCFCYRFHGLRSDAGRA